MQQSSWLACSTLTRRAVTVPFKTISDTNFHLLFSSVSNSFCICNQSTKPVTDWPVYINLPAYFIPCRVLCRSNHWVTSRGLGSMWSGLVFLVSTSADLFLLIFLSLFTNTWWNWENIRKRKTCLSFLFWQRYRSDKKEKFSLNKQYFLLIFGIY